MNIAFHCHLLVACCRIAMINLFVKSTKFYFDVLCSWRLLLVVAKHFLIALYCIIYKARYVR